MVLLLGVAPARAAAPVGEISGTVTDASTQVALPDVEVDVFDSTGAWVSSATTDSGGHYTVGSLVAGGYRVEFTDNGSSHVSQFYNGEPTLASADPVTVASGSDTSGVDAALTPTGEITGTVTDAVTHTPVPNVQVNAYDSAGNYAGEGQTDHAGHYSILGLAAGSYRVQFFPFPPQPYGVQYYAGKPSLADADAVVVKGDQTTSGIDALMSVAARIAGTVTDATSHQPIGGAEVDAIDASGNDAASAITDADGKYTISGLAPGQYRVYFASGDSGGNYSPQYYNGRATLATADAVTATAGQATTANAALSGGGELQGTITDAQTHQPVAGVGVIAYDASGNQVGWGASGDDGTYEVDSLATGSYTVGFWPGDGLHAPLYYKNSSTQTSGDPVSVTAGQATPGIDAALPNGAAITGTVTDAAANHVVGGVEVTAYDASGAPVQSTLSATDGTYTLGGLAAGSYRVGFGTGEFATAYRLQYYPAASTLASATPIPVALGQTTTGINVAMHGGGSIEGTVTDAAGGQPLPNIQVNVYASYGWEVGSTTTDSSGHFFVGGVSAASYVTSFVDPAGAHLQQYYDAQSSQSSANPVTVTTGQTTQGIDAAMTAAATISGVVTDAATHQPVAGVTAEVLKPDGTYVATTSSAADGSYSVGGLAPGAYALDFWSYATRNSYLTQFYNGQAGLATANLINVSGGQNATGINAALQAGGGISGSVTDPQSGAGVSGATVTVYDSTGAYATQTTAAADGSYSVGGLSTGTYRVGFSRGYAFGGFASSYYNGKSNLASADPIGVTAGQTTPHIDGTLPPAGGISGTVTDASLGAPLQAVQVIVYDSSGAAVGYANTDSGGVYTLTGLTPGSYRVGFRASGYGDQYYKATSSLSGSDTVVVSAGNTAESIDAAMQRQGVIEGTVTGAPGGGPLAGVSVQVEDSFGDSIATTTTDSAGDYALAGLTAGSYTVEFVPAAGTNYLSRYYNGQSDQSNADTVNVTDGSVLQHIDDELPVGGEITGHITSVATGAPLAGVAVTASGQTGSGYGTATTDAAGNYAIVALPSDGYAVLFSTPDGSYASQYYNDEPSTGAPDPVSVTAGDSSGGIDAAMQLAARIEGTVTDAGTGTAVQGVGVRVYDGNDDQVGFSTTDATGAYTVAGLAAGTYRIQFVPWSDATSNYLTQYYNGKDSLASADTVTATVGQTITGIDAALRLGGQVSGTVTDSITHKPIANAGVTAYGAGGGYITSTQTGSDGTYTIVGLPTGSYEVAFSGPGNYGTQFYKGEDGLASADPVAVTAGSLTSGIDGALRNGGAITGTVTDASTGRPLSGVQVVVPGVGSGGSTTTDANGNYAIEGLSSGSYTVQFSDYGYSGATAGPVSVTSGQTSSGVNASMTPQAVISGTVSDAASGDPVPHIWVQALTSTGTVAAFAQTDPNGNYVLTGLPAGTYDVEFVTSSQSENYLAQFYNGQANRTSATPVTVASGQTLTGINAALQPGAQITGVVKSAASGQPLAGVYVEAIPVGSGAYGFAITDSNGNYTLDQLSTASYQVYFYDPAGLHLPQYYNGQASAGNATAVAATQGQTSSGINASLAPAGKITGTVLDAQTGRPVDNAYVTLYSQTGSYLSQTESGSDGTYSIGALTPGSYKVGFTTGVSGGDYGPSYYSDQQALANADAVTVTGESTTSGIDGHLTAVPENFSPPAIAGTAQQDQTLSEQHGSWTQNPTSYSYQWLRCRSDGSGCSTIFGATGPTYTATASDVGYTLEVTETASNAGGPGSPTTSAPTAVVLPAPPVSASPPAISGRAQQGQTLTEQHAIWSNNPTGYTYEWLRCNTTGANCAPIAGASTQTYVPVADDVGSTLEVEETASNAGGTGLPAVSWTTAVVVPPVPVNKVSPSVAGTAQQGQALTEQHGTWTNQPTSYGYSWLRCNAAGTSCTPIFGATAQAYTPTGDDVGHTIEVVETATNAGGDGAPATSGPTAVVLPAPPVNSSPPSIPGVAQQGVTLTLQQGEWSNNPTSYSDQWLRCDGAGQNCSPIAGATGATYTPAAADVGATLVVAETATNAGGTGSPADSAPTATVLPARPSNTTPPTVPASAVQGQTVSAEHGGWTNAPTSYSDQWLRCDSGGSKCTAIDGATSDQYVPVQDDVGHALEVQETASNAGGDSDPSTSAPTDPVSGAVARNTLPPSITGTAQQGQTLSEQPGWWTNQPTAFSYQWLRCDVNAANCTPIAGATSQTYEPTAADVGNTVEVEETATNSTGDSQPAASAATQPILPAAPLSSSPPTISGTPEQGQTLTEQHAVWSNNPTSYAYQWLRCDAGGANCTAIDGATSDQYVPVQDDIGQRLEVQETASNAGGTSAPAVSAATAVVGAAVPQSKLAPTITGTAQQGKTLTEEHGSWTNQPTSYSYQWVACDAAGANCAPISGATDDTYAVTASDVGKQLAVQEVANNGAGDSQPAQSDPTTTVIPPAPVNSAPPTISGTAHQGDTLTVQHGTWSGEATSYAYQWLRCDSGGGNCQSISGATDTTYVPAGADVGNAIEVQETAQGPGGAGDPAASAPTAVVTAAQSPMASLELSQSGGTAPFDLTASIGGVDPEGRAMTYSLDFGDGTTVQTGSLPADPAAHTYQHAGDYVVRLSVDDGALTDVKTANIVVALSAPLAANAGDDQVATINTPVHFDGSASTPTAGIESYHWDFGDGSSADGETADHTYTDPGSYTAKLTVTADGQTSSNTATITVNPKPAATGLQVTVTDDSSNPLSGADLVVIDGAGNRYSATTDATGIGDVQGLADGSYTVYVWKQGYLPATVTATVSADQGSATVSLQAGQAATTSLTSTPLTKDQIIADGIDPNDPANQNVYEFAVHLHFTPFSGDNLVVSGEVAGGAGGGPGTLYNVTFGDGPGRPCTAGECWYGEGNYTTGLSVQWVDGEPDLLWLIIPGKAKWLKEFFDVQMMVTNLSPSGFTLDHGAATLPLPSSLSLAPTSKPQQSTVDMPDIPGGQSATADWIVRGDTEGYYPLQASYAGVLDPIGASISLTAQTQDDLHVWGGSALRMTVDTDDAVYKTFPYRVRVGLTNVADIPIYNPEVDLLEDGRLNYIYQPQERLDQGTGELDPGQTFWTDYYRLVPEITGSLDLGSSFIVQTAGNATIPSTITSHPADDPVGVPKLTAVNLKGEIGLQWDPVPGATGYQVFDTPTPDTPFPDQPDSRVEMLTPRDGKERAVVRGVTAGTSAWFAVSSTINGKPTMVHPMVSGASASDSPAPTVTADIGDASNGPHTCGETSVPVTFTFRDSFFGLKSYTVSGTDNNGTFSLSGDSASVARTITIPSGGSVTVTAQGTNQDSNSDSAAGPKWSETFDTACAGQPAIVLAAGLNSNLSSSPSQANDDPVLSPPCNAAGQPQATDQRDSFDMTFATNACDALGVTNGNLVSYLESKGYMAGANRASPNRTLLEFSYNGAEVNCDGPGGPTFIANGYSSKDTYRDLATNLSVDGTTTADGYVDALKAYSDCWKEKYGVPLTFTVVGHSEGGYNALAIARSAQAKDYKGLISGIVSVDGAQQPPQVEADLNAGGCLVPQGLLHAPADVFGWFWQTAGLPARFADDVLATQAVGDEITSVQQYGTRVATVTNGDDPCLYNDATLNPAADWVASWDINYLNGADEHGAALTSHGDDINVNQPGFPLANFLGYSGFVGSASTPVVSGAKASAGTARSLTAAPADTSTGTLRGRLVDPNSGQPIGPGAIDVVGGGSVEAAQVSSDGTFAASGLSAGSYELYTEPAGAYLGTWVGGTSRASATQYPVSSGTTDVGDIAPGVADQVSVTLKDASGGAVTGGSAALFDGNGHEVTMGQADENGTVTLSAAPGSYTLVAASPSSQPWSEPLSLSGNAQVSATLLQGARAGVVVTDEDGNPLANVLVGVYSGSNLVAVGQTGADGTYFASGLADGPYTVKLYDTLDRFDLPDVSIPVQASADDPAAGVARYTVQFGKPVNTAAPSILGTAQEGQTLTDSQGTWSNLPTGYSYQWQDCDSSGANCSPITGATGQSYTITASDIGQTVRVQETASNAQGSGASATSDPTAVVVHESPANTSRPTVSGPPEEGATLTEAHGSWTESPTKYAYQWQDCDNAGTACADIAGATAQSYVVSASDVGHTIRVMETATNDGGDGTPAPSDATSVIVPLPPSARTLPSITGNPQDGTTLAETHGSWTDNPTSYSYQWEKCDGLGNSCSAIAGATDTSYKLTDGDVGHTIRVQETAGNAGGVGSPATSDATSIVLPLAPANSGPPSIGGIAQQGNTLSETHGAWSNSPTAFTYQWERCDSSGASCQSISGATSQTYTPTADDVGSTLVVEEVASDAGGASDPAGSSPTAVVLPAVPVSSAPPSISGSAERGQTLTEGHGQWSNHPTGYAYQWERCDSTGGTCQAISGATSETYIPVAGDVGSTLVVQETASNAGGPGSAAASSPTQVVQEGVGAAGLPVVSSPPSVSGTARQGQTLTEGHGTWSNGPSSYAYQWEDCDAGGANCVAIAAATGQSYTLVAGDVGDTIRVQEVAANAGGSGSPASSDPTSVVLPLPPANSGPPSISGSTTAGQTLSESHGSWSGSPTGYTYKWEDCDAAGGGCTTISGATSAAYSLTSADVGHTIRVQEAASNAGGSSGPASSSATGVVVAATAPRAKPSNNSPPTLSGTTTVGQTLFASTGTWSGTPPISYAYEWQLCRHGCADIPGATGSTHKLTVSDVGARVQVVVSASNSAGTARASSTQIGPVTAAAPAPAQIKAALFTALRGVSQGETAASLLNHGGYAVSFSAPSAGRLLIAWYLVPPGAQLPSPGHRSLSKTTAKPVLVASVSVNFHQARRTKATIALTGKGRQLIKTAAHLRLIAVSSFTPRGGPSTSVQTAITIRR